MAEPEKKKIEPEKAKPEEAKIEEPKKAPPKTVVPKAVIPKTVVPKAKAVAPQKVAPKKDKKKDGMSDTAEEFEEQQPKEEENLEDMVAQEKMALRAKSLAEQEMTAEQEKARLANNHKLRWYKKEVDHSGKYFSEMRDIESVKTYDRTMRVLDLLLPDSMLEKLGKGLGTLLKAPGRLLQKPIGVTPGTVAPLNGDMKKVATGVSNTIKHGVTPTPQPSGPKQDGPKQKAPEVTKPKASAKPSGPGGGPK